MHVTGWLWPGSQIVRIIDGDTLDVVVTRDLGFCGTASYPVRLRLNRINAPAVKTKAGELSRRRVVELLPVAGLVDLCTLKPYKYGGPKDSRGEYMAEVTLADGRNLSDVLVGEAYAVYWDGTGPRPDDL